MAIYHTYARCQVGNRRAKLETGAKTEHGRPDQNTNARKLVDRKYDIPHIYGTKLL